MTETTGIITEISSSNNSLYQEDKNKANTLFTVSIHTDQDQIETLPPGSTLNLTQKEANDLKNLHRKRGRIKKDEPNSEKLTKFVGPIHTKYNQDNIKRKIKTHFHAFIIAYLNVEIKKDSNFPSNYRFKKMESKIKIKLRLTGFDRPFTSFICSSSASSGYSLAIIAAIFFSLMVNTSRIIATTISAATLTNTKR